MHAIHRSDFRPGQRSAMRFVAQTARFAAAPQARIETIAHRGDFYRQVENTLPAFRSAIAEGADAVELDVQLTKDGVPVVYHDDTLPGAGFSLPGRTKPVAVGEVTYAQLQRARFDKALWEARLTQRAGQPIRLNLAETPRIPTLEEVLRELPDDKKVYVELKRPGKYAPNDDNLARSVVDLIRRHKLQERAVVISFNLFDLMEVKRLAPEIQTGLDIEGDESENALNPRDMADLKDRLKIDYWLPPFERTTRKLVEQCHALGLKIAPWVYHANLKEEQGQLAQLANLGVDGLISNQPGFTRQMLDAQSLPERAFQGSSSES